MKDNLKTSIASGVLFALIMGLFLSAMNGSQTGILGGAAAGLTFGLATALFLGVQERKAKKVCSDMANGVSVIMNGGANHFRGVEGVGGWLYLTNDEVIFKSHRFNVQVHQTIIPLDDIEEVKPVLTAGLIPNGLLIRTKGGNTERFVVNNRKAWVRSIDDARRGRSPNSTR